MSNRISLTFGDREESCRLALNNYAILAARSVHIATATAYLAIILQLIILSQITDSVQVHIGFPPDPKQESPNSTGVVERQKLCPVADF